MRRRRGVARVLARAVTTGCTALLVAVPADGRARAAAGPVNTSPPTIVLSHPTANGVTATANPGAWKGTGAITYAYEWQVCSAKGRSCTGMYPPPPATEPYSTRTVKNLNAPPSTTVRVVVTATDAEGSASAASKAVDLHSAVGGTGGGSGGSGGGARATVKKLVLVSPRQRAVVHSDRVTLVMRVVATGKVTQVALRGRPGIGVFARPSADGLFRASVILNWGRNAIVARASTRDSFRDFALVVNRQYAFKNTHVQTRHEAFSDRCGDSHALGGVDVRSASFKRVGQNLVFEVVNCSPLGAHDSSGNLVAPLIGLWLPSYSDLVFMTTDGTILGGEARNPHGSVRLVSPTTVEWIFPLGDVGEPQQFEWFAMAYQADHIIDQTPKNGALVVVR
jgi:hypothetical protein